MNFLKTTVALFTLVTVANLGAVEKAPPIDFLSPQGGELYIIGQTQKIVIKTTFKTLALEISRDGGVTFVALGTANLVSAKLGAQFVWTVNAPASTNAMLRATGNKRGKVSVVKSQAFVIDTGAGLGGGQLPGTIGTALIADGAVTNAKLGEQSVSSNKISSGQAGVNSVLAADGSGGTMWSSIASLLPKVGAPYVLKEGDTMTGALNINAAGTGLNVANDSQFSGTISVGVAPPVNGQIAVGATTKSFNLSVKDQNPSMVLSDSGTGNSAGFMQVRDSDQVTIRAQIAAFSATHGSKPDWFTLSNMKAAPMVFSTSALERLRIDAAGNTGINTPAPNSTLQVNGAISLPIRSVNAPATLGALDYTIVAQPGANTINLPTAVGIAGRIYVIKNLSGANVSVTTVALQTIDNAPTPANVANTITLVLQSDGANWVRLN